MQAFLYHYEKLITFSIQFLHQKESLCFRLSSEERDSLFIQLPTVQAAA